MNYEEIKIIYDYKNNIASDYNFSSYEYSLLHLYAMEKKTLCTFIIFSLYCVLLHN